MNADYFQRAIPKPYRILGLKLKPLSIGRYRILERFNVAFVSSQSTGAKPEDLILGLLVCANRCDEFLRWLESPGFSKDVERWRRKMIPARWLTNLPFIGGYWRRKVPSLIEKMQLFQSYIEHHSKMPKYWNERESDGQAGETHWLQGVEVTLRSQLGWTEEEINEQPLGKALADYFQYAQTQGAVRLMSEAEEQMGDENSKLFERLGLN